MAETEAPALRRKPPANSYSLRLQPPRLSSTLRAPCQGGASQWVRIPPGSWSLQPVAIGAAVEATKPSEPLIQRVALGDSASMQAETRVNAEQASKQGLWEPTRLEFGEGRRLRTRRATACGGPTGVLASACMKEGSVRNTGSPSGAGACPATDSPRGSGRAVWGGGEVRSSEEAG